MHHIHNAFIRAQFMIVVCMLPWHGDASLPGMKTCMPVDHAHQLGQWQMCSERKQHVPVVRHDDKRMQLQITRVTEMKERSDQIVTLFIGQNLVVERAFGQEVEAERFGEPALAQGACTRSVRLRIHDRNVY